MKRKREGSGPQALDPLISEDLLEFQARNGIRSLCHLLVYRPVCSAVPICVVGNFDSPPGPGTTNAIEAIATAIADRLDRDEFGLYEWLPRRPGTPFSEITLRRVEPQQARGDRLTIAKAPDADTRGHLTTVRYADPQWTRRSEDDMAQLLGEPAIRQLRAYAGLPGDYQPQRLFGTTGRLKLDQIHTHNQQAAQDLQAQIQEWTPRRHETGA